MLDTLIKIGKWKASGMKPIERFLTKPKNLKEDKSYYVLNLVFDLDEHYIYSEILKKFDTENDTVNYLLLKTLPGNNKAIYATVEKGKINNLLKSFFGKINNDSLKSAIHGELFLKAKETGTGDEGFLNVLDEITKLKIDLLEKIKTESDDSKLNPKLLLKGVALNKREDIGIITASVKSAFFGFAEPVPVSQLKSYKKFINDNLLSENEEENEDKKLCYATGEYCKDVDELKLEARYSLNKMFVTETKNYASGFNTRFFTKNYQVSKANQKYLDIASGYFLNNYKTTIAGIPHVIIPVFLSKTDADFDLILGKINKQSDFLFKYNDIRNIETVITDWVDDLYWLNFLSIDSDGKYFKSNSLIKDVSKPWFLKVIDAFTDLTNHFSEHYGTNTFFNFYSFYQHIPVKTGLKKNEALVLFNDIFEHRTIDKSNLFHHFTKYLIVQRSGQFDNSKKHRAYSNIREQSNFDYAIFNDVMDYLAFFQFLKKLNLLNQNNMEKNIENVKPIENAKTDYAQRIENFFSDMGYNASQKALFYLGRALNQVAYAQYLKSHKNKPVLNKLDYNGMDKGDIIRLRLDLAEKAKQYGIVNEVEYNFTQFTHLFNPNNKYWLSPEENIFYILSGYSFGMIKESGIKDIGANEDFEN